MGPNRLVIKTTRHAYVKLVVQTGIRKLVDKQDSADEHSLACVYTVILIYDTSCWLISLQRSFTPVADHESWLNSLQSPFVRIRKIVTYLLSAVDFHPVDFSLT